jgi:hypothetical protein
MMIGEVRSKDPSEIPFSNDTTTSAQILDQNKYEDKDEY